MSAPSPPSFAQFFDQQPRQRTSSNSSNFNLGVVNGNGVSLGGGQQYDEPGQLRRTPSHDHLRSQTSSTSLSMNNQQAQDPSRQESFPFDTDQATLIATAPNDGRRVSAADIGNGNGAGPSGWQGQYHQDQGFGIDFQPGQGQNWQTNQYQSGLIENYQSPPFDQFANQQQQYQQFSHHQQQYNQQHFQPQQPPNFQHQQHYQHQQQHSPFILPADQHSPFQSPAPNNVSFTQVPQVDQPSPYNHSVDQNSPFGHFDTPTDVPSTASTTTYEGNFIQGDWSQEFLNNGNLNGTGDADIGTGLQPDEFFNADEALQELERIISAASSAAPSRAPSPFQEDGSRPTSQHGSPMPNPPFANHQSPPALIIPGNSPSPAPALPPINTNTKPILPRVQPAPSNPGGLFPPANPALTGMAGISPIHPNADGPMIFVQPSTPISGLKEGRGVWEAALRQATQNQNQNADQTQNQSQQPSQEQGNQSSVPPPQTHAIQQTGVNGQGNVQGGEFGLQAQQMRPRAKSDSHMADVDRQIMMQMMAQQMWQAQAQQAQQVQAQDLITGVQAQSQMDQWSQIDAWRSTVRPTEAQPTLDPRSLPGQEIDHFNQQPPTAISPWVQQNDIQQQHQLAQLQAQRAKLAPLNTAHTPQFPINQPSGSFSPTSMAFYQSLGMFPPSASQVAGTASAPFYSSTFQNIPQNMIPQTANLTGGFLGAPEGLGPRRRSFAEGMGNTHPAAGAGTPGYGVKFTNPYGRSAFGHRRGIKSEDFGQGWGLGQGGSTNDFLQSITANDGSLLPPSRGRASSRSGHSSASSVRSPSPALSVSSQGSSMSHHSPRMTGDEWRPRIPKMKVTSMATEVASSSRRTNDGVFQCPIPGCGSTFTRHFNLKGHLRSHNDERPYKCLYDGCPKSLVGFARQHDCKRHMLLHEGLRPFECEGCGKKFARLDALTRHHKSEQGQECAISHPLPVNPDGTPMSESQYKAYKGIKDDVGSQAAPTSGRKSGSTQAQNQVVKQEMQNELEIGGYAGYGNPTG